MTGVDWGGLFKTDNPAFQWTLLFVVYLLANFLVQGFTHIAFTYTMVYTLAFLLVSITISKAVNKEEIGTLFAVMTLFVGTMTWITSMAYILPETGMWLTIVFTAAAFLNEYGIIETKGSINNKYCLLAAFGGIFLFGILYFLGRLGFVPVGPPLNWPGLDTWPWAGGPLPWHTIINHLGITLLAGSDMLLIFGVAKWKEWRTARWLFTIMALAGAVAMLYYGWGLYLI